jgi:hypothetical protein
MLAVSVKAKLDMLKMINDITKKQNKFVAILAGKFHHFEQKEDNL